MVEEYFKLLYKNETRRCFFFMFYMKRCEMHDSSAFFLPSGASPLPYMANNKADTVTMRSLRAGNDGAFRHELQRTTGLLLASVQLQQWACDTPPHEVSCSMQRSQRAAVDLLKNVNAFVLRAALVLFSSQFSCCAR